MTAKKVILPLLFLVPVLLTLMTSQPLLLVMASDDTDNTNIPGQSGQGQQIQTQDEDDDEEDNGQGPTQTPGGQPQCITAPCPTEPNGGPGGQGGLPQIPSGRNLAEANQLAGIGSGNIQQNAQGAVNEQYCSTIAGIGDRRCAQFATPGADNIQDCTAIAGLGKANCVQSENPDGSGTCLTANGRPYICNTATGTAISGSGQAGQ